MRETHSLLWLAPRLTCTPADSLPGWLAPRLTRTPADSPPSLPVCFPAGYPMVFHPVPSLSQWHLYLNTPPPESTQQSLSSTRKTITLLMKMPERSRTSRVSKIVQSFCPKVVFLLWWETHTNSLCDVTWRHDVILWPHRLSWRHTVTSHDVTPQAIMISHGNSLQAKAWKSHFLTLTFDLRPWPTIQT